AKAFKFAFQGTNVSPAAFQSAQGIAQPTARFGSKRFEKILHLPGKSDGGVQRPSSFSTSASLRYLSLPALAARSVFMAAGLARISIVSSRASNRSRGT